MLPELKPFFDAVMVHGARRERAIVDALPHGSVVWWKNRTGETLGPAKIFGKPTADARIQVEFRPRDRRWIKVGAIVAKGSPL